MGMTRNEYRRALVEARRRRPHPDSRPPSAFDRERWQAEDYGGQRPAPYRGRGYLRLSEPASELGLLLARQAERRRNLEYRRGLAARDAERAAARAAGRE